jgi:hypothetical protein
LREENETGAPLSSGRIALQADGSRRHASGTGVAVVLTSWRLCFHMVVLEFVVPKAGREIS